MNKYLWILIFSLFLLACEEKEGDKEKPLAPSPLQVSPDHLYFNTGGGQDTIILDLSCSGISITTDDFHIDVQPSIDSLTYQWFTLKWEGEKRKKLIVKTYPNTDEQTHTMKIHFRTNFGTGGYAFVEQKNNNKL